MNLGKIWCPCDLSFEEQAKGVEATEREETLQPNFVLSIIMSVSFRSEIVAPK